MKKDKYGTPRLSKYSLIISVVANITGQRTTPAVWSRLIYSPWSMWLNGSMSNVTSNENILTLVNSAKGHW